jgi:hypothetical protein
MLVGVLLGACGADKATPSARDISSANGSTPAAKTSPAGATSAYPPGLAGNAAVPTSIGVNNASPVWIVADPLSAGSGSPGGSAGSVRLFELDPLAATLTYQGDLLGAGWASGARLSSVRIERVNPTHAFAFVSNPTSTGVSAELVAIANAGKSWSRLNDSCASLVIEVRLSAPFVEVVWMGCGSVPSAGNQDKAVFRSDDGGG